MALVCFPEDLCLLQDIRLFNSVAKISTMKLCTGPEQASYFLFSLCFLAHLWNLIFENYHDRLETDVVLLLLLYLCTLPNITLVNSYDNLVNEIDTVFKETIVTN